MRKENEQYSESVPGFRVAAPSWVTPGTIYENCRFLENKVDEAALLFFDAAASLAYTRQDLPLDLASLSLSYHAHLPLSPPWDKGGEAVAAECLKLMDNVAFLDVRRCVLHPPHAGFPLWGAALLEDFARAWRRAGRSPADVFVENTRENDLAALLDTGALGGMGLGVCLDLGHMLAYGQYRLARFVRERAARGATTSGGPAVGMIHCNMPGSGERKSAHMPLDGLDAAGAELGKALCAALDPGGIIVAEFFSWEYVARSLPVIRGWMAERILPRGG